MYCLIPPFLYFLVASLFLLSLSFLLPPVIIFLYILPFSPFQFFCSLFAMSPYSLFRTFITVFLLFYTPSSPPLTAPSFLLKMYRGINFLPFLSSLSNSPHLFRTFPPVFLLSPIPSSSLLPSVSHNLLENVGQRGARNNPVSCIWLLMAEFIIQMSSCLAATRPNTRWRRGTMITSLSFIVCVT